MKALDLAPAAVISLGVTMATLAAQLLPFGTATVLVRLADAAPASALRAAAGADAALVAIPAPGFAVLHGDAARVRAALGLAVLWKGRPPCSTSRLPAPTPPAS